MYFLVYFQLLLVIYRGAMAAYQCTIEQIAVYSFGNPLYPEVQVTSEVMMYINLATSSVNIVLNLVSLALNYQTMDLFFIGKTLAFSLVYATFNVYGLIV